ncbi:MAG TPA: hypothetical protein VL335_00570 [Candidatus Paceibacterota bacterium]|jgi:UDPglucose 6-dehydrogenase|nr:hypothetical protein [Candidatus Paceibacterota bacterium]
MADTSKPLIGFIGQGWIGKNYSNDLEARGFTVVRYGLEDAYKANKAKIKDCDIVFIAVPTPTTKKGFDDSYVRSVLPLVGKGKIAVIKSTLIIGCTERLQKKFKDIIVTHSPEFLSEKTAAYDAAHPDRNIVGIPVNDKKYIEAAELVLSVLPPAPFSLVCSASEAELIKYSHNVHGYIQVVFANILYDLAQEFSMDWEVLFKAFSANPLMVPRYLRPVHQSGRGAGGNCFVKDFEAFIRLFESKVNDKTGIAALKAIREKNIQLLVSTGKDIEKIKEMYGHGAIKKHSQKATKRSSKKLHKK